MLHHSLADVVCLSHLRWNFVFQRPQHLMTRWAKHARVFYVEEPIEREAGSSPCLEIKPISGGLSVVVPRLPRDMPPAVAQRAQARLLEGLVRDHAMKDFVLWYYTPMAMPIAQELRPRAVVYDCMDQLAAFRGAPSELTFLERQLLDHADVVMAGGHSLWRAKQKSRSDVHLFPSSVDATHFGKARAPQPEPEDQRTIPRLRLGFFGVIDERMDLGLLAGLAAIRPEWHLVMVGPVVKIDEATLPRAANIHYLGQKSYAELPQYIAGWDMAILPFARNEATRFISPTKTPEYLASGRPVVSTAIADVVEPYGRLGLVRIADSPADFALAIERALAEDPVKRLADADVFLATNSWDATFCKMASLIDVAVRAPHRSRSSSPSISPAFSQQVPSSYSLRDAG
jgi:glycosyltransferase involved in cell wall biosynthesis